MNRGFELPLTYSTGQEASNDTPEDDLCLLNNLNTMMTSSDQAELSRVSNYINMAADGNIVCLQPGCSVSIEINSQADAKQFVAGTSPEFQDCVAPPATS